MIDLVEKLEKQHSCAGFCKGKAAPFYMTRTSSSGPPEKNCRGAYKDALFWAYAWFGIPFGALGVVFFIAFNLQYGFWKKYRKEISENEKLREERRYQKALEKVKGKKEKNGPSEVGILDETQPFAKKPDKLFFKAGT